MDSTNPDRSQEPTHFEILSISTRSLDGQDPATQTDTIKKAYRRALLKHHPDKQAQTSAAKVPSSASTSTDEASKTSQHFTVDQITEAYNVLSDVQQRRKYTRTLRQKSKATFSSSTSANVKRSRRRNESATRERVETVELDDMSWSGKRRLYYRACQGCGKARGFGLREDEIDDDNEDEDVEIVLECSGCGTELRVIVPALVDETGSEEGGDTFGLAARQSQTQTQFQASQRNNMSSTEPAKKSRGWGLRLGLGLGLSLGGGASTSATASR